MIGFRGYSPTKKVHPLTLSLLYNIGNNRIILEIYKLVENMDYKQARFNMIEQQVRTWEVLDQRVLDMLSLVHREDFIPTPFKKLALSDVNIPLAHNQVTMQPKVEARLIQSLNVSNQDKILEIGTGCAYLTAILAKFGKEVISIDIFPEFTTQAKIILEKNTIHNVKIIHGDGINGWSSMAPYNVIVVTGSLPLSSSDIEKQLKIGGRLFVISGISPVMEATLITRISDTHWTRETLFETDLPALVGAKVSNKFIF
jgi:protein-L-isoaspartate(D-aspartate) O-methyltransferase